MITAPWGPFPANSSCLGRCGRGCGSTTVRAGVVRESPHAAQRAGGDGADLRFLRSAG
ncbi:hypothetical protein ATKI12_1037 [Kitasatospora sp. Ki12]